MIIILMLALAIPEREMALGLWRRWLGADGTGPRWVKIVVLCLHEAAWYRWAVAPVVPLWLWDISRWSAWPVPVLVALALLPVYVVALCLWFVWGHNNGGEDGSGGTERYGIAGIGYLLAYPLRALIPEAKIGGWSLVSPGAWTEVGEIVLGRVTGRITGLMLAALFITLLVKA